MSDAVEHLKGLLADAEQSLRESENRLATVRREYEDHGRDVDEALQRRNNWRARCDALIEAIDELGGDIP